MGDKYLWKFGWDCGRIGEVEGLFVTTQEEIEQNIGKRVYFGEILGKHSDIQGTLDMEDLEKMDLDSETVERVTKLLGETWSGYNPLDYIDYICEDCGYSFSSDEFDIELNICKYCRDNPEE